MKEYPITNWGGSIEIMKNMESYYFWKKILLIMEVYSIKASLIRMLMKFGFHLLFISKRQFIIEMLIHKEEIVFRILKHKMVT